MLPATAHGHAHANLHGAVAVLYSGRWYGPAMQPWVDNHLENLIRPFGASVYLVTSLAFWCSAAAARVALQPTAANANATLLKEVRSVFGHDVDIHAALVPEPNVSVTSVLRESKQAAIAAKLRPGIASAFTVRTMIGFKQQFLKVAKTELLLRESGRRFRYVVRARVDILFAGPAPVPLTSLTPDSRTVYGLPMYTPAEVLARGWAEGGTHDWFFVTGEDGIAAISRAADDAHKPLVNESRRCFGLCQEEQLELQLEAMGIALAPLVPEAAWNLIHVRVDALPETDVRSLAALGLPCSDRPYCHTRHATTAMMATATATPPGALAMGCIRLRDEVWNFFNATTSSTLLQGPRAG